MRCARCKKWMVDEIFYSGEGTFKGWRCIWCGEISDVVILENRGVPRDLLVKAGLITTTTGPPEVRVVRQVIHFQRKSWRDDPFL